MVPYNVSLSLDDTSVYAEAAASAACSATPLEVPWIRIEAADDAASIADEMPALADER